METVVTILVAILAVNMVISTLVLGVLAYRIFNQSPLNNINIAKKPYSDSTQVPDSSELESQQALKRKIQAENEAFNELLSYSADRAYGIEPKEQ